MSKNIIRPEAHEIDTLARRLVPLAFPIEWEHRELTGRDYGVDMVIEVFESGIATGNSLSLQIKGTKQEIDKNLDEIIFDMPANTLRYSEMFVSPVLLIICPIADNSDKYFLWLQDYIKVVLNYENPGWRSNKATVRLKIPIENCIKGNEDKIMWISNYPKRTYEFFQLAMISNELSLELNNFSVQDNFVPEEFISIDAYEGINETNRHTLIKIVEYIDKIMNLKDVFGDERFISAKNFYHNILVPSKEAALMILKNDDLEYEDRIRKISILHRLESLSAFVAVCNDYSIARQLWELEKSHNF